VTLVFYGECDPILRAQPVMLSNDGADNVYPPSEDTHLLMDVLMSEAEIFKARGGTTAICLEIG
jgi:hypothetical protein